MARPINFKSWALLLLCSLIYVVAQAQETLGQPQYDIHSPHRSNSSNQRDGITSPSHRELMQQYDIHYYKLNIQLERTSVDVKGNVIIQASSLKQSLPQFAFELHPQLTIDSVLINNRRTTFQRNAGEAIASLPSVIGMNQVFNVQIYYGGKAPTGSSDGDGLNHGIVMQPLNNHITWSLSEPFAAYEWFPCKQLLEDKADSLEVWVTTDVTNKVGSNGLLKKVTSLPNNKHRYEWKSNYPIAYYLISVAIGQYQEYSFTVPLPGVEQPLLVQNYIYEGANVLNTYKAGIDQTGPLLQTFSNLFGVYPFYKEKYGHSMAPMGGGMEHQTMTTQSSFEFTLTAHELAHQWWGDEVTCADWSHIWLNEGFASYAEYLALSKLKTAEEAKSWIDRADISARISSAGSVFVRDSLSVPRIFSSNLSYRKGAFVLHMLRRALGNDSLFFQSLRAYRAEYKYKVADTRDLQRVVEQKSGKSFQQFFDQWIYGEGYPNFDINWAQEGNQVFLKSVQTPSSSVTPLFVTDVEYLITTTKGDTLVRLAQNENSELYSFNVSGTVESIEVDPDQWLLEFTKSVERDASLIPTPQPISEIKIYPNPTAMNLQIEGGPGVPDEAVVLDLLGRKVIQLQNQRRTLDLEGLKPGTYLLKLRYGQDSVTRKFMRL